MQLLPSYHLVAASPLPLDIGCIFLVGSGILLLMIVQQLVAILEFSQEKMSTHPSILPNAHLPLPQILGPLRTTLNLLCVCCISEMTKPG